MDQVVKVSIEMNVPITKVWEALTNPDHVRKYFFGTNLVTDWKVGSPIFFRGSWEGKSYEDKGKILEVIPEKRIAYTYWSGFSGVPDSPENYKTVTYDLEKREGRTLLTVTQDNNKDEASKNHSEQNWKQIFEGLKQFVENGRSV